MKYIFTILILLSIVFGIYGNKIDAVSNSAIGEAGKAIELSLTLAGGMCLWCGVMQVAKASGLTKKIAHLLSPITSRLFKGTDTATQELISMNITANILGLGNAATPLGLSAMKSLAKGNVSGVASNNMIMLVVINTASLQLIPTTVATMRLRYGCNTPLDILPCVLISSAITLIVGVTMVLIGNKLSAKRDNL